MKHATVTVGEFTVPLIGIPMSAVEFPCDRCGSVRHISDLKVTADGKQVVCKPFCRSKFLEDLRG